VRRGRPARISRSMCLLFLLCSAIDRAIRQQPSLSRELLLFMDVPTVITATGRKQLFTQVPSAITVITAEEIRPSVTGGVRGLDHQTDRYPSPSNGRPLFPTDEEQDRSGPAYGGISDPQPGCTHTESDTSSAGTGRHDSPIESGMV
jgi:hypothetical protein